MNNYGYDAIGNLIRDSSENIGTDSIKWNVYGKITSVSRSAASTNSNTRRIEYTYDAAGNRIGKKTTYFSSPHVDYTWYVRDAQGNVLNVYSASKDTSGGTALADFDLLLQESILYGSSRLGLRWQNVYAEPPSAWGAYYDYSRGYKYYELANHLGNVVTVISDKKLGAIDSSISTNRYAYYNPELVMANDYYAFGMERLHYDAGIYYYRYGFNGKENDRDVKGEGDQINYGARVYDPRVGRFLSVDPLQKKYPWNSVYAYAENDVIRATDLDGLEKQIAINGQVAYGPVNMAVVNASIIARYPKAQQDMMKQSAAMEEFHRLSTLRGSNSISPPPQAPGYIESTLTGLLRDSHNDADNIGGRAMFEIGQNIHNARESYQEGNFGMGTLYLFNAGINATTLVGGREGYGTDVKVEIKTDALPAAPTPRVILYHYTTQEGQDAILNSKTLNPSLKAVNPGDARYGDGQYLSDIAPGTKTPAQLSKAFLNLPYLGKRFTNYVAIDVTGLNLIKGRDGVFLIPNAKALDLTSRIVGSGTVQVQAPASSNNH